MLFRDYFGMHTEIVDGHLATAGMTAMILTFIYIIEKGDERTFIDSQSGAGQDD